LLNIDDCWKNVDNQIFAGFKTGDNFTTVKALAFTASV